MVSLNNNNVLENFGIKQKLNLFCQGFAGTSIVNYKYILQ